MPKTIYFIVEPFGPAGGLELAAVLLATELKRRGHRVAVSTRQAVPISNQYAQRLAAERIPFIRLPVFLAQVLGDYKTELALLRVMMSMAAPPLALAAAVDAVIRQRAFRRSWQGAWGKASGWLSPVMLRDYRGTLLQQVLDLYRLRHPPDVVHVHGYKAASWGLGWASRRGIPAVYTDQGVPIGEPDKLEPWRQLGPILDQAEIIIAICENHRNQLRAICGVTQPIVIVPNMAEDPWRDGQLPSLPVWMNKRLTVGYTGRLTFQKGLDRLLPIVKEILGKHPHVHFLIAGDGPERDRLVAQAQSLGIADHVTFHGPFVGQDLPGLMAQMDIFVSPSRWEAGPITLIEAMAYGKPIVATAVGMGPDLVQDGISGFLAPPEDVGQLAEGLCRLVEDADLRAQMGRAARRFYENSCFTPQAVTDEVLQIYERVCMDAERR